MKNSYEIDRSFISVQDYLNKNSPILEFCQKTVAFIDKILDNDTRETFSFMRNAAKGKIETIHEMAENITLACKESNEIYGEDDYDGLE